MEHVFKGKWITNSEFADLKPRNVFHKELDKVDLPCDERRNRHGLILDLVIDGETVVTSDESFKTCSHTAYTEMGICGYQTQFLERYDSNATEVGFALRAFDNSNWKNAKISRFADHTLTLQKSSMLEFETILPVNTTIVGNHTLYDFGSNYVGYLYVQAKGKKGDIVTVRCAQELNDDGTLRYNLRANCTYEEEWVLSNGESHIDWFDYKSFRYAEISTPASVEILDVCFCARHYPFALKARL